MKKFSMLDDKAVGDILKIYRKSNHMTQQRVADYLGTARSTYAKYETMRKPHIDVIIKLSALYNISLDDFLSPFFSGDTSAISTASSTHTTEDSGVEMNITEAERMLLEYYRGSIRKAEILKTAENIFNADIELISEIKE